MDELTRLLEHECQVLEQVRYRTCLALLLLRGDEARFLPRVSDEIHQAVDQLAEVELGRALAVARLAEQLGVPEDELTLTWLIAQTTASISSRLGDLQERLRAGLTDLQEQMSSGTAMASHELTSIRRSLVRWTGPSAAAGYGAASLPGPSLFDGSF